MAGDGAIRAVLFDAAGTLIELCEPVGETYARTAARYGVKLPGWRLEDAFTRILRRAPAMAFPEASQTETIELERDWWRNVVRSTFLAADSNNRFSDFERFFDELYLLYSDPETWRCRPGCRDALSALRTRGIATAVVSNFDQRLPRILAGLGVMPLLDDVVLASDARATKPDPRIFELALERVRATPAASVFVGDSSVRDIAGARAMGMRAIDVTSLATLADLPERLGSLEASDQETTDE